MSSVTGTLQLGGEGKELSATLLTYKLATTAGVKSILWHHLIRSSSQGGGNALPVDGIVNHVGVAHRA
jgi:hypothetical protein